MDKIEELLTRGVDKIYPSKEELEKILRLGKKLKLYQGFDPTGTQLHIGHMVGLMKLRQWQDLGHHVIFLIGDFTAMIGDPTGKYSTRKKLSHEQTLENAKSYKDQASKILKFEGENPAEVLFNGDWLGKISAIEFFKIAGLLSVQQVVERDMFQERQKQGQDIFMSEFLYPIMQAYDCVEMNVDLELGGKDQMFNMLMGRKLMRHMLKKDKFVMTTILLEDFEGKKIGKTERNAIALTDNPNGLFGKVMTFPDEVIVRGFETLTFVPMEEIKKIEQAIKNGENPMQYKKKLAFEITKELNNEQEAKKAQEEFENTIQKREAPVNIPVFHLAKADTSLLNILVDSNLSASKSEAKRVIEQKGVSVDNRVVDNPDVIVNNGQVIQVGKHKFLKIKTESNSAKAAS